MLDSNEREKPLCAICTSYIVHQISILMSLETYLMRIGSLFYSVNYKKSRKRNYLSRKPAPLLSQWIRATTNSRPCLASYVTDYTTACARALADSRASVRMRDTHARTCTRTYTRARAGRFLRENRVSGNAVGDPATGSRQRGASRAVRDQ